MSAEHENRVNYNIWLTERLAKYCKTTGEKPGEIKREFKTAADPYNMKSPEESNNIYCDLMDKFLTNNSF